MKKLLHLIKFVFQPEYRKEEWRRELRSLQERITHIEEEIPSYEKLVREIHEEAVGKDSAHETVRDTGRRKNFQPNYWLLSELETRATFLKKKLGLN